MSITHLPQLKSIGKLSCASNVLFPVPGPAKESYRKLPLKRAAFQSVAAEGYARVIFPSDPRGTRGGWVSNSN